MRSCPSEQDLRRAIGGELPPDEESRAEAHIDGCRYCTRLLADAPVDEALVAELRSMEQRRQALAPLLARLPETERSLSGTLFGGSRPQA